MPKPAPTEETFVVAITDILFRYFMVRVDPESVTIHDQRTEFVPTEHIANLFIRTNIEYVRAAGGISRRTHNSGDAALQAARAVAEAEKSDPSGVAHARRLQFVKAKSTEVLWMDGFHLGEISDLFSGVDYCKPCGGHGETRCDACAGRGKRTCGVCSGQGSGHCFQCGGRGRLWDHTNNNTFGCPGCSSTGRSRCGGCNGDGSLNCYSCGTRGVVSCGACAATGLITTQAVVEGSVSCELSTTTAEPHELWMMPYADLLTRIKPAGVSSLVELDDDRLQKVHVYPNGAMQISASGKLEGHAATVEHRGTQGRCILLGKQQTLFNAGGLGTPYMEDLLEGADPESSDATALRSLRKH